MPNIAGINPLTMKPLNEITKAVSGSTPNPDNKNTSIPSLIPSPATEIGMTSARIIDMISIKISIIKLIFMEKAK